MSNSIQNIWTSNIDDYEIKCTLCDFIAAMNTQMNNHMSIRHDILSQTKKCCTLSYFKATTNYQLEHGGTYVLDHRQWEDDPSYGRYNAVPANGRSCQ